MNKIISIVLLCSLLLMCLSSCALTDKIFGNNDSVPEKPEVTPPENPNGTLPESPNQDTPQNEDGKPVELQVTDDRVVTILDYLENTDSGYPLSMANMIDRIKADTAKAMLVNFYSSESYFVCGYYTDDADPFFHTDAPNYTWVKFDSENEITEEYKDLTLVISFQFSKASMVSDIITPDANVPNIEHFQVYFPVFEEGINISDDIEDDDIFVYVCSPNESTLFVHHFGSSNLPFVHINGKYYLTVPHYRIMQDGTRVDTKLDNYFGKYYDALLNIMIKDKYSVTESGYTAFYGLIEFKDFL